MPCPKNTTHRPWQLYKQQQQQQHQLLHQVPEPLGRHLQERPRSLWRGQSEVLSHYTQRTCQIPDCWLLPPVTCWVLFCRGLGLIPSSNGT